MDSEWRPPSRKGERKSPVAILQLSTREHVCILDLLHLSHEALDSFLARLFLDEAIIKTGFAFDGDLRKLRESYPDLRCFHTINSMLNLEDLGIKRSI